MFPRNPSSYRVKLSADAPKDSSVLLRPGSCVYSEKTSCKQDNLGGAPTELFLEAGPTARTLVRGKSRQARAKKNETAKAFIVVI